MNSVCCILLGADKEQSSLTRKSAENGFCAEMPLISKWYHVHCGCSSAIYRTIQLQGLTITDHDFLSHFRAIWKRTSCTMNCTSLAWAALSESPDSQPQRQSSLSATQGCRAKFNLWSENLAHFQTWKNLSVQLGRSWGNEDRIAPITQLTCLGWECCHWL